MSVRFTEDYRPLYFLSALGAGGLSVSFFMYLMFLVKHPATPIPTVDDLAGVYRDGSPVAVAGTSLVLAAIGVFAVLHLRLLVANLGAYRRFRGTPEYQTLRTSNAEVTLMTIPLTLGMSVNVAFIVAALSIPGLWSVVEYLFPLALVAMGAIGGYALFLFGRYVGRILAHRGFDLDDTNHFSQALPSFAFAMVAVGFSSPAAMSHTPATAVVGMLGTFLFASAAVAWIVVKLPVSFAAMLRHGMATEAGPTLWMGIPIFTLFGIAAVRVTAGVSHTLLHTETPATLLFVALGLLLSAQLVMGAFGWTIMRRQGYLTQVMTGQRRSIASYGLICPGVALFVLAMFFIHWGLVKTHLVTPFSPTHVGILTAAATIQAATVVTWHRLNRVLLGRRPRRAALSPVAEAA